MTRDFINKELNQTFRDRANKLKGGLHLLLSLASALTTALIPLSSFHTLSPCSRSALGVAVIALFVSFCSGMAGLVSLIGSDQSKLRKLRKENLKSDEDLARTRCITGGTIWPIYIFSAICAAGFVLAIFELSVSVKYILFP